MQKKYHKNFYSSKINFSQISSERVYKVRLIHYERVCLFNFLVHFKSFKIPFTISLCNFMSYYCYCIHSNYMHNINNKSFFSKSLTYCFWEYTTMSLFTSLHYKRSIVRYGKCMLKLLLCLPSRSLTCILLFRFFCINTKIVFERKKFSVDILAFII